jgi:hypothetical protein
MRNLIFAGKMVGAKCVEYLLNAFPDDQYVFVVCEPGATAIVDVLEQNRCKYTTLSEDFLDSIRLSPERHYDWLLNLWGNYIFKSDILSRASRTLNIHPAYLPFARGRDPIVWAIRHGYPAGVTLHEMVPGVDEGPIWYREEVPYRYPITGGELYGQVIERCWRAFCEQWPLLRSGDRAALPQESGSSPTRRRKDLWGDRRIDADSDLAARDTLLRLLAHDFSPGYTAQVVLAGKTFDATLLLVPSVDARED